jgi:hypothetical protein
MQVFTTKDHLMRCCSEDEVGHPWEDRWSIYDVVDGLADSSEVGKPKMPSALLVPETVSEAAPAIPFRPLTKAERKQLALELMDKILIRAHSDPAGFMEDGSSQLNKFLEWANKADAEDNKASIDDMTAQAFSQLPPVEQDRAILDVLTMFVADDRRRDALERLGMSEADYEALYASAGRQRV